MFQKLYFRISHLLLERVNKSTRPAASCFHQFPRVWNPDKTRALVFQIIHKRFRPATRHYKQILTVWREATSCPFLRLAIKFIGLHCDLLLLDFQLLAASAVRLSTFSVSEVLAGKLQKHDVFIFCSGLRILTAKELLVALLARALFLSCTEPFHIIIYFIY